MTNSWAQNEREAWLRDLDNGNGIVRVEPGSIRSQLVTLLDDMLSGKCSPKDSASKTAALVMSDTEPDAPFAYTLGLCLHAAEKFESETALQMLVDYFVALATLPDAINEATEAKTQAGEGGAEEGPGGRRTFQPGEAIVLHDGILWRDLPGLHGSIAEITQGPEQYLVVHLGRDSPEVATTKWRNVNTWLACLAKSPNAQAFPVLAGKVWLGFKTLVMALEQPPHTRQGQNVDLHAPAAAQWLRVAEDELARVCAESGERFPAGDLWKDKGGNNVCDSARLRFWRERLVELGF